MRNQAGGVLRRLSDPDFQGTVVDRVLAVCIGQQVVILALVAYVATVWLHPPQPKFFRDDGRNAPQAMVALDHPLMDDNELLRWTVKAVLAPYNVNYYDFPEQLNTAGKRFLPDAWNGFAKQYMTHGNLDALKRERLLCYAQPQRAAIIRATRVMNGRLAYDVQFPVIQTCQNVRQENTARLMMTALVVRTNVEEHEDGLAVAQLVAAPF